MAPGFFAKLAEFGKKVWNGIKTGAKIASKVLPVVGEATQQIGQFVPHPAARKVTQGIGTGLGFLNPIVQRIADS